MHELYRVLSAISADTFSQHFRTYFIIPCNPMIYKHLKLLLRPQWSGDIRTVRAREGSNIQKRAIHRMSLFCIIESTRRSPATTAAERRHSNRSNPAGLEHTKKEISNGYLLFCIIESTRRDSNPRPSPWQGDTPPLSHSCVSGYHHDSMDLLKCQDKKSVVYCGGYEKIYWSGQHMEVKERKKHWKHQ